jgi:hypothetical protein
VEVPGGTYAGLTPEQMVEMGIRETYRAGQIGDGVPPVRPSVDHVQGPLNPCVQ